MSNTDGPPAPAGPRGADVLTPEEATHWLRTVKLSGDNYRNPKAARDHLFDCVRVLVEAARSRPEPAGGGVAEAVALLEWIAADIGSVENHRTHWTGCEESHPRCRTLGKIRAFLATRRAAGETA